LVNIKENELDHYLVSDSKYGKKVINVQPSGTITTTKIQVDESEELEEGECLFHLQVWVKRTPLHFIVDSEIQNNLILIEVIEILRL
jgi:hypothetical protein